MNTVHNVTLDLSRDPAMILSLYEPELDITAYDEAADRSVTIAVMGDELTPRERKHYAELIVKAVNSHDALVAALEGLITAYELGNEDQLRTEVTDAYSALEQVWLK